MTKDEAKRMYEQYVRRNVVEPLYARCCIQWHDDFGCGNVTIALFPFENGLHVTKEEDDEIFFYCNGLEDFLRLFDEDSEDFTIREIYKFSQTL